MPIPSDAQALGALAEMLGSGGALVLLGWAVARVGPALKAMRDLAAIQAQLAAAQLVALGDKPEAVPKRETQVAEDVRKIRVAVEARGAA